MAAKNRKTAHRLSIGTMLSSDLHRLFTQSLLYYMMGISFIVPILVLTMTSGFGDGTAMFSSVWQSISSVSGGDAMAMDITTMCNMNLLYFGAAAFVCLFIGEDFTSGYAKHLFTVRAKRTAYTMSKIICCFIGGTLMLAAYFAGAMIGGKAAGLSFAMEGFHAANLSLCLISKVLLMAVFVAIYAIMAVIARHRVWLSILLSLFVGMFLFMMIPMMTPLDAGPMQVILCLAGGALFAIGSGIGGGKLLEHVSVV